MSALLAHPQGQVPHVQHLWNRRPNEARSTGKAGVLASLPSRGRRVRFEGDEGEDVKNEFIELTGTPRVTSPLEPLHAVGAFGFEGER
jgi:hypothetical protein